VFNIRIDLGEVGWSVVYWIDLAQDRSRWRALVNAVITFRFHEILELFRVAAQPVASRLLLSSIELDRMEQTLCKRKA
jgi:hypothetical protein